MKKIKVAIVGIGNNAASLIQGCYYYRNGVVDGLKNESLGSYRLSDIDFVCGFDVNTDKINVDLSEAIFVPPNNFPKKIDIPHLGSLVSKGVVLDSLNEKFEKIIPTFKAKETKDDSEKRITGILIDNKVDVVVNFLPAGSLEASKFYAKCAALAGCAFINSTPEPIVHDESIVSLFEECKVPLLGDDLESQVGATTMHRTLLKTLELKGVRIVGSYQINLGGNMDFQNLMIRGDSKSKTKKKALLMKEHDDEVYAIPASAHMPFLGDKKIAHIHVKTEGWLGSQNTFDLKVEIEDSSSAAANVADLIRIAILNKDSNNFGVVKDAGFYFKNPVEKLETHEAEKKLEKYFL